MTTSMTRSGTPPWRGILAPGAHPGARSDRKLLFTRRYGTHFNCPATRGLATFEGNPSSHRKERASSPMAVLDRRYAITCSYVNLLSENSSSFTGLGRRSADLHKRNSDVIHRSMTVWTKDPEMGSLHLHKYHWRSHSVLEYVGFATITITRMLDWCTTYRYQRIVMGTGRPWRFIGMELFLLRMPVMVR